MSKKFIMNFMFILLGVILLGAALFLVPNNFSKYQEIAENGITAEAKIVSNSSDVAVNDVRYYYIRFVFEDKQGNTHEGRTSTRYTYYEVKRLSENKTIVIKYDPATYESIEANYSKSEDKKSDGLVIMKIIFIVVSLGLIGSAVASAYNAFMKNKIDKYGVEVNAQVLDMIGGTKVNGVEKFSIKYSWSDPNTGEFIEKKTTHKFTKKEAQALIDANTIRIKVLNKKSYILTNVTELVLGNNSSMGSSISDKIYKNKNCQYCGGVIEDEDASYCPLCGARISKDDES